MKYYKKFMNAVAKVEGVVLALSLILVTALAFGNVVGRKVFNHSWGFTEEITVAVFVLISLLGAGLASRTGELVNLALLPDLLGKKAQKVLKFISSLICLAYSAIMLREGWLIMAKDIKLSPILHVPVKYFDAFVVIGAISLIIHFIENCVIFLADGPEEKKPEQQEGETK